MDGTCTGRGDTLTSVFDLGSGQWALGTRSTGVYDVELV